MAATTPAPAPPAPTPAPASATPDSRSASTPPTGTTSTAAHPQRPSEANLNSQSQSRTHHGHDYYQRRQHHHHHHHDNQSQTQSQNHNHNHNPSSSSSRAPPPSRSFSTSARYQRPPHTASPSVSSTTSSSAATAAAAAKIAATGFSRPGSASRSSSTNSPHQRRHEHQPSSSSSSPHYSTHRNDPDTSAQSHHSSHSHSRSQSRHHQRRRTSPSGRPVQDVLPHNDYETSKLATSYSQRSSSRDRPPPPPPRGPDSSRPHRRSSSRSNSRYHSNPAPTHARDMAPTAVANNGAHTAGPSHTNPEATTQSSSKPTRSRTMIPTQTGNWILGKTIGAGSMGKVKLARKEDGSEQVACKIIPRGSTDDGHHSRTDRERADQSKEIRTAREAAIVTLLNHPHICGLRDVVRTNYHWYMLFEYVNGGQMLDYIISHGKLKEKQARKFSRQIASALDYCHRNSIVHRDLKIENILISKTGDIKIIDFGLSNLFAPRGHLKTFCGSLYFAAPELLQARAYTGPEVDVWSFGIVLYVLVCGKVPFDDQSMPALHAKIKKGLVDYPSWLSSECKHLMSRMLVTDPKQRATMHEVMTHPWMIKGFGCAPDNYLPTREPLNDSLEPEVVHAMQGFSFGTPESITAQLTKLIESEEYQRAIGLYQKEKEAPPPPKDTEKRKFGLDFYKRRNSGTSRDTLTGPSSEALQLGTDPLNAYSPLLSIYFLVKEKQDRERTHPVTPSATATREKEREREARHNYHHHSSQRHAEEGAVPELTPPQAAHTNAAAFEMPGEQPTGGRSRPRARTHGEDDAPENEKQGHLQPPETKSEHAQKKEGTAAGLLRRFSTRKGRKEPERLDKDRSHPPMVQVHSPSETAPTAPRKSFSIRRGRRDRDDQESGQLRSGSSQPQHSELLSPPASAGGNIHPRRTGLGRSTSVNSADLRRRGTGRVPKDQPPTSGSDQSVLDDQPPAVQRAHGHARSASMRTKSLGHARRESVQRRRLRREAHEANVPEETDMELEQEQSGVSTEGLDSSDLAKPVFLKGLFSVSTTSGKSVPAIRADIKRVLKQLNVDYTEIKGGFHCKHTPSIDVGKTAEPPTSPAQTPGHRRRFSFGGLMRGDGDKDEVRDTDRPPTTPRTPGRSEKDHSYSNSETSVDSIPRRNGGASKRAPGETSTQVQSDLGDNLALDFEIFIVKVPLLSLHGIQFKRMTGNTWQYKNMADHILRELRL